jgi:hypothetical protein
MPSVDGQIFFFKAWHMDSHGSRKEEPRDASAGLLDDAGCVLDWPGVLPLLHPYSRLV